jgi:glycosyltransferase involved in cell wall biosynthesis
METLRKCEAPTSSEAVQGLISIVVQAFNEQEVLTELHKRISAVLEDITNEAEIIYVNDGSTDGTLAVLEKLRSQDPRIVPDSNGFCGITVGWPVSRPPPYRSPCAGLPHEALQSYSLRT